MVLDCFNHAFVINADTSAERLSRVTAELEAVGIARDRWERFSAIVPAADCRKPFLRPGEVGCILSHVAVVSLAKSRGYESVLILEDDATFRADFTQQWQRLQPQVKALTYDLFYFYDWGRRAAEPPATPTISAGRTYCTHCYAVHSRYYDDFLKLTDNCPRTIDTMLYITRSIRSFVVAPSIVGQFEGGSLITKEHRKTRWNIREG